MQVKTILFPTDFSDVASNALDFAANWASQLDADLILLHVQDQPYQKPAQEAGTIPLDTVNTRMINAKLESLLEDMLARFGIRCRSHIEEGQPSDVIPKVARETGTDLIVMGTIGASGFAEVLEGTLTVKVMSRIKKPLLIIPQAATYQPLRKWAYAADLQMQEDIVVSAVASLAGQFRAQLELLHVQEEQHVSDDKVLAFDRIRRQYTHTNMSYQVIRKANVLQGIDEYVRQQQPDLLIMIRHEQGFWSRLFKRDTVSYSAYHANFPLLVLHEPQEDERYAPNSGSQSGAGGLS